MKNNSPITVTSPLLPNLDDFSEMLKDIWSSKWITNNGQYHKTLETELCKYLKVPYISLFTNGTLPLITALQALRISGEVITTPFSFVATTHSIWWNDIKPVFVDIDPRNSGLDPDKIEAAITPKTTAIMPVHCYGKPCDTEKIQAIADKYGLKVIYDAAHAFGVEVNGESILNAGDMSTLSFHATKVYNTIEGGALVMHDEQTKKRIDYLKNFGFAGETEVVALVEMTCSTGGYVVDKRSKARRQLYNTIALLFSNQNLREHITNKKSNYAIFSWKATFDNTMQSDAVEDIMKDMFIMTDEVYSPDNEMNFDFGFKLREIRYPHALLM